MSKSSSDKFVVTEFAQLILRDSQLLPMMLFRRYRELRLNEEELIQLVRVLAPAFHRGFMTLEDVMAEFSVAEQDAKRILQPFLDREFIEHHIESSLYTCEGLLRTLFLLWAGDQRPAANRQTMPTEPQTKVPGPTQEEKERIRQVSHLYRRFEQEMGRSLKYSESDRLRTWLDEDAITAELIEEALRRSVLQDKCTFAYIGSILRAWQRKHLNTLEMVELHDAKVPQSEKKTNSNNGNNTNNNGKKQTERSSKFDDVYEKAMKV